MTHSGDNGFQPRPMKTLFQRNGAWADIMETYPLRDVEVEVVTKMLACGTPLMGSREFCCENGCCTHHRYVHQSCNGRGCPTCGKKATDIWIATMMARLPDTACQHGTFTLPDTLWPLFAVNRWLLGHLFALAADNLLYAAEKRGLTIGIFGALHTYGRQLNWNCHLHLSWTTGGLNTHGDWKKMSFALPKVRERWIWNVRQFLLSAWESLSLPPALAHIRDYDEWRRLILGLGKNAQGEDYWHVYFAKPTKNARQTAKYLGRYLKKPPVAGARLAHYDGGSRISLRFLDHRTGHYGTLELSQREMILRLIQHIPEKHFRMIRYFGFLANRVVGKLLPLVKKALGQEENPAVKQITFAALSQGLLNVDPFRCILCGGRMVYRRALAAVPLATLVDNARDIARMRFVG
ncbi:IS91 family transposase [Pantoea stewartii]|uniref:IS91 family transposase n=2 Tax=Pantoea stewartii subsp. stewartii DC283 TaxID=660596 RepID=A0ABM6KD11_PANSE|nr:IS91 family transposase [Pantoea stewartii]ARF52154.1 IS91 family transposase [Pantoea stewartii subsp. stewartii DC283]KAB0546102.1 IS91 family transposase [Pantoea stewartii subsp. stewartii]